MTTQHTAIYIDKVLTIGCKSLGLDEWVKQGIEIGKEAKYTDEEIEAYMRFILYLKEVS